MLEINQVPVGVAIFLRKRAEKEKAAHDKWMEDPGERVRIIDGGVPHVYREIYMKWVPVKMPRSANQLAQEWIDGLDAMELA